MSKPWDASNTDYVRTLYQLYPRGLIWSRDTTRRFYAFVQGIADELVRVHNSASDLVDESDPQTTTDLVDDWERVLGLPEPPGFAPTAIADRRDAIVGKLAAFGGQSADYFEFLGEQQGDASVTVTEPITGWPHVWQVASDEITPFRADISAADDPLTGFTDLGERVRFMLEKYKPAHTRIHWVD